MRKCFIVCPIGSEGSPERIHSDKLLNHVITPICTDNNFDPIRIDLVNKPGLITDDILKHLKDDELVIADLTRLNPNAFYEIGYRAAIGKPLIQIKSKQESIPFDVSTIRTFEYDITDLDSVAELKTRLSETIQSINFDQIIENVENTKVESNLNSNILQTLFSMQDDIREIKTLALSNDTKAISVLADKLQASNTKTPEIALMEQVFQNPQSIQTFLELSKHFPPADQK